MTPGYCSGDASSWTAEQKDSCLYNAGVAAGGQVYHGDSCMSAYLSTNGTDGSYVNSCYSGTSWLYAYGNQCDRMSGDMRLSLRAGAEQDKCASRVFKKYVEKEDLWSLMYSEQHDPCGWPFVECVADCSLPSNPAAKGWTENTTNNMVYDGTNVVGCTNPPCDLASTRLMRRPSVANQIAAM